MLDRPRRAARWPGGCAAFVLLLLASGCDLTTRLEGDPLEALRAVGSGPRVQLAAMAALDERPLEGPYLEALRRAVWRVGYTVPVREAAVERLESYDRPGLMRTLRQHLPKMTAWLGLTRLCEIIAEQGWTELTPALVSSWARPHPGFLDETQRPEYKALVRLHGVERIPDVVFDLFRQSSRRSQQGLRTRCWELLHRLGDRPRLVDLLISSEVPDTDGFLLDLQAVARELGIVPYNREEILWARRLRQAQNRPFWDEAVEALARLPAARRAELELRDVPVIVAAARHDPALLEQTPVALYERLHAELDGQKHYSHGSHYDDFNRGRERLGDWKDELTWGDLLAMLIARRALAVPEVVDHLFDYADRDHEDKSTEYGGILDLDRKGRFEVLEFPPRIRQHDQKFIASQAMLDAAYTALFHFHDHAQQHHNARFAGPGYGDVNYADNTRANCLVFTFVRDDALNVDFYRHGRVQVDLGVIER